MSVCVHVLKKPFGPASSRTAQAALAGASLSLLLWKHVQFCHLWTAMTRHKSMLSINSSGQPRIAARCRQIKFSKGRRRSSSGDGRSSSRPPWPPAQLCCNTRASLAQVLRYAANHRSSLKLFKDHKSKGLVPSYTGNQSFHEPRGQVQFYIMSNYSCLPCGWLNLLARL